MRPASRRHTPSGFRPHVLTLEERLPLGDGVLGLLVGAALLPPHAVPAAVPLATQPTGARDGGRISNPSVWMDGWASRPTEEAFTDAPHAALAAPDWAPLTDPFAPTARRRHDTLFTSPQREQGPDAAPLLALRAGEERGTAHVFAAPAPRADGVLLATLVGMQASAAPQAGAATPAQEAQVKEGFGKLPLYFEENVGQTDNSVHFFARGPGYGLFLTSTEAVMVLQQPGEAAGNAGGGMLSRPCVDSMRIPDCVGRESMAPAATAQDAPKPPAVVRMQWVGASATPAVTGRDEHPGKVNYFLGNDPAQWHTNIATFGRVQYDEVYPGIDLVYYGNQRQLEYDFVVAPGADPSVIRLNVSGAERLEIDAAGDLLVTAGGQELLQHKPFVYQTVGDTRQEVASRFVLEGQQVRFVVAAYDAARPLVIDPVLSYSTYLGGSDWDYGSALAVDPATGDALLTGSTASTNFPTANPLQAGNRGSWDVFVTRLSSSGGALAFSTYLGGNGNDYGEALAVHPATGDALVTGFTVSTNFPTANPLQAGNRGLSDVFVARLNAFGNVLVWSTYLGGSVNDVGLALAADSVTGDVLVTGYTDSTNYPTANPLQPANRGRREVFVTRLNAAGSALAWSTYLGGRDTDEGYGLAMDSVTGDTLVSGRTQSTNFPIANPFQPNNRGAPDAFVARLSAAGNALVWSTYLGGGNADIVHSLAVDPITGDALLTGNTSSVNFPTANPLQPVYRGGGDVFVARLSVSGSDLVFSTYLGGSGWDYGTVLAVDPVTGDALVSGWTFSTDFPTANPFQPTNHGGGDAFVTRLRSDGAALVWSTYLGGGDDDRGYGLGVNPNSGDALVSGWTFSTDFPTANPFQPTNHGGGDAFVTQIGSAPVAYYYVYPDSGQVQAGVPFDLYVFALDAQFHVIPDYTGLILFSATDPLATTPVYYEFQRSDRGVAYFPDGLTFNTPGFQELYVFDWPGVQVFGYAAFDVRP